MDLGAVVTAVLVGVDEAATAELVLHGLDRSQQQQQRQQWRQQYSLLAKQYSLLPKQYSLLLKHVDRHVAL